MQEVPSANGVLRVRRDSLCTPPRRLRLVDLGPASTRPRPRVRTAAPLLGSVARPIRARRVRRATARAQRRRSPRPSRTGRRSCPRLARCLSLVERGGAAKRPRLAGPCERRDRARAAALRPVGVRFRHGWRRIGGRQHRGGDGNPCGPDGRRRHRGADAGARSHGADDTRARPEPPPRTRPSLQFQPGWRRIESCSGRSRQQIDEVSPERRVASSKASIRRSSSTCASETSGTRATCRAPSTSPVAHSSLGSSEPRPTAPLRSSSTARPARDPHSQRSALEEMGYTSVVNLDGGIVEWKRSGLPTVVSETLCPPSGRATAATC